ncbi:alpha/beta hydrolase [Coleofasciculus sp. LEGE 07092]|nr:alpha/beta hydrolase [Coleofasciculus sp. LEGE 07081]MBE9148947.1 alpha/beta hydrolase [Coleofasciculus sp. LEGE 07092]
MPIYSSDPIAFEGIIGYRHWINEPFTFTGVPDIDERLSGFPIAVFLPPNRPTHQTPLVIGLQGMCAPYGWNAFIVPTLTQMGIAVALFDTPLAGERSLARTFSGLVQQEITPLLNRCIPFDTPLLLQIFSCTARDIRLVQDFCRDRYNLTDSRLALFGISMGVLLAAFAFNADGIGKRLLGTLGHADLQTFAKSWGKVILPDLAVSPLGKLAEVLLGRFQPELKCVVSVLRVAKSLKEPDSYGYACNPMTYIDRVKPPRRVRFLVGKNDPLVRITDAQSCATRFPDGACYIVPGMGHGTSQFGSSFVDHVRYFLVTQLGDWQSDD